MRILSIITACCMITSGSSAQSKAAPVWRSLNDSMYVALGLSPDQVTRTKVIEEDYEADRVKLQYDPKMTEPERKKKMNALIIAREKDVQRIFTKEQFTKWLGRDGEGMVRPRAESLELFS